MRILVVSQYFWPESFRINELVAELGKRGHQVTVLTGLPNYPDGRVYSAFRSDPDLYSSYAGARVLRVPILTRGKSKLTLALNYLTFALSASVLGAWKIRRLEIDVIFVFEISPISVGVPSALFRWLKGAPQVFWVLDLWPDTLKAVGVVKSKLAFKAIGYLVKWVYRHSDVILVQSRSFVSNIERYAPAGKRIEYFPQWADENFDPKAVDPAPEVKVADGVFTVMFAGNIGEAQDFPAILDAAEMLKERDDIRWIIVGDGRMAGWVRQEIDARGLSERMAMVGRFPPDRMPSFFVHADALLVSLRREDIFSMTIPGKLQSYLGSGVPVLAMLDGEGARLVENANAGLVCAAGDSEALSTIVKRMAGMDSDGRKIMGENGRRLSELEFDRDRLVRKLDELFSELT